MALFLTAVFWSLIDGVVLTTDDLLADEAAPTAEVLPAEVLPDAVLPEACTLLEVVLPVLLFLLTELLVPMPPLSDELLPNMRSELV